MPVSGSSSAQERISQLHRTVELQNLQIWKFERADIKKMPQDERSSEMFLLQLTSETSKGVESVDVGDSAHFRRRVNTAGDARHIPREWRG